MQSDDQDAIEVDEFLDELTELLFVPRDSPVTQVRRAIPLRAQRPALVILPEEPMPIATPNRVPAPAPKRTGARRMQLTPFAARARR